MRGSRIAAMVAGSLVGLVALAVLISGIALGAAYLVQRDDGYLDVTLDRLDSDTVAVTAERIDLRTEPGTPRWVIDALDTDVRLRVTGADAGPVFVGIAREADLDRYLAGVAHDEIRDVDDLAAQFRARTGGSEVAPPADQAIWEVSAAGDGTQEIVWEAESGRWAVAVMNADGSPGVSADVNVGVRSGAFLPAALGLLAVGALGLVAAALLILYGGAGLGAEPTPTGRTVTAADAAPTPAGMAPALPPGSAPSPLTLEARLDPDLSNWKWLIKWFLAIPHLIVLGFLWIAYVVLTIIAGFAILFTGRYPRGIFDINVGVLRWGWRVSYYAFSGGLGTDRYPPFSLGPETDYPASLDVEYPEQLSRGLVLVKWWLLAIPHYIVVAIIAGGGFGWDSGEGWSLGWGPTGGGLVGILTLVAAVVLLVTRRYPPTLFDLIVGLNRWVYRVVVYASLMTDRYPPFRLDQGGAEPGPPPAPPSPSSPEDLAVEPSEEPDSADESGPGGGEPQPAGSTPLGST